MTCYPEELQDREQALELARDACEMTEYGESNCLGTLALALHRTGDSLQAIEMQEKALGFLPEDDPKRTEAEARLSEYKEAVER